jgi:threonine-phosphate decarboxylase
MIGGKNTVVLRAITKDFSAPGLRVGFIAAHRDIASSVRDQLQPWPLNCVGEAYAVSCAKKPEPFLSESAQKISVLREGLYRGIRDLGFVPNPGGANFLLVRSDRMSAGEVYDSLISRGILIRKCANFPTLDGRYFRVAVKNAEDNAALIAALASIGHR